MKSCDPLFKPYLASSRKYLSEKLADAGMSDKFIKGNLLRIGSASAYANSSAAGMDTAEFMGIWTSGGQMELHPCVRQRIEKSVSCDSKRDGREAGGTSQTSELLCAGQQAR